MGEWSFLGGLFDSLQAHSPMLGRFWLLIMLVFRILILGTIATDMFQDEQEEFACNTLQPGCKQVCYDMAFPISQYRFWVFHIVLIATPSLVFLMYAMHHHNKQTIRSKSNHPCSEDCREDFRLRRFYFINVAFRIVAEVGFLVGQWFLYGFRVEAQFPCSRFPCPYTVDCFVSRPAEKTIFLCFYFIVGVIAAISSCVELLYGTTKWFCTRLEAHSPDGFTSVCENLHDDRKEDVEAQKEPHGRATSNMRAKRGAPKSGLSRKASAIGHKHRGGKYAGSRVGHIVKGASKG